MFRVGNAAFLAFIAAFGINFSVALAEDAPPTASPSPELTHLQQVLTAMGYSPKSSGKGFVFVNANNYSFYIVPYRDSSGFFIEIALPQWPKGSENKAPLMQALDYNDSHSLYLSTFHYANGLTDFDLNDAVTGPMEAPVLLKAISALEAGATETRPIWDSTQWK